MSVADSQIVYYKQLRGGQMEVWLARYLDDSKRSVPVPQKRQLKQHHAHQHYEYELGNATLIPDNPGNPPVF